MTNLTTKQTDKTVSACVWCGKAYEEHRDKPFPNGAVAKTPCGLMKSGFYAKNPTTHSPTETVSDCCNAPVEWRYEGTEGDMTRYYRCSKCKRDFIPPTDTDKKVWGSICCNVGVMCRGIGKEHYHICNKCNKKCEVKYEKPVIELSEHDQELIREGRAMSDFDTRRGV